MKKRIPLWKSEEYHFSGAGKFIPFLMADIHGDNEIHPAMMVVPGGGFILMSPGEADAVADQFYHLGYNTFVLVYTNNVTLDKPMIRQALPDASRAVRLLRKNHRELCINPDKIIGIGFSGGGHLVASLATLFDLPELQDEAEYAGVSNRLDAAVLTYALVTCGEYTCAGAYDRLLGSDAPEEERKLHSLELQVKENTVPMFILHGTADAMVPAQNALLMADACARYDIPYELHLFLGCDHGFAVADFDAEFTKSSKYVFEQLYYTIEAMTAEELAGYGDLFSELEQGMQYDKFAEAVQTATMTKLWMKGLNVDFSAIQKAINGTSGNMSHVLQPNPSSAEWWISVDHWIHMLFG